MFVLTVKEADQKDSLMTTRGGKFPFVNGVGIPVDGPLDVVVEDDDESGKDWLPETCVDDSREELRRGVLPPTAGFGRDEVADSIGIAVGTLGVLFGVLVINPGVIIGVAVGVAAAAIG